MALRQEYKNKSYAYLSGILKSKYGLDISRRTLNNILNRTPVYLSKLTLIEEKESTIYDVHVEDNHSYITTNGYINHNTGGAAIINSTPYGVGNFYHSTWVDAIAGGNPFNPLRLYWQMHPERDINWYNEMSSALGTKRTAQEIDGDFLSSGNTVFDLSDIKAIEDCLSDYPVLKKGLMVSIGNSVNQKITRNTLLVPTFLLVEQLTTLLSLVWIKLEKNKQYLKADYQ